MEMKKTVIFFVLTIIITMPQQIKAQIDTDSAYKIVGSAIGREIRKSYDQAVSKRRAEKAEQERKEQEYWKNYPNMKREEERAEKNRHSERIEELNFDDDVYKDKVINGVFSYSTHNARIVSQNRPLEYYHDVGANRITAFSEEGEPLVFRIGCVDDNNHLGLIISGENGPIVNEQRITFSTRMDYHNYGKDEYWFLYDDGTITIPANTEIYRVRFSRVFPKFSSSLRGYKLRNVNELKSWDVDDMTMLIRDLKIKTKVSNKNIRLTPDKRH